MPAVKPAGPLPMMMIWCMLLLGSQSLILPITNPRVGLFRRGCWCGASPANRAPHPEANEQHCRAAEHAEHDGFNRRTKGQWLPGRCVGVFTVHIANLKEQPRLTRRHATAHGHEHRGVAG